MDIVDAYVAFCETRSIPIPSERMQVHLRIRLKPRRWKQEPESLRRVHRLRMSLVKLHGGENPKGVGDKFDMFCVAHGRVRPTEAQIAAMNEDAFEGARQIRSDPDNPKLYTALSTFKAYGGF